MKTVKAACQRGIQSGEWAILEVFGVTLSSNFVFTYPLPPAAGKPEIRFTCVTEPPFDSDWAVMQSFAGRGENLKIYRLPDCLVVRLPQVGDFYIWPGEILCHPREPWDVASIELYFLGRILTIWQESQNRVVLHASAVMVGQQAIAFAAQSGSGKTGLAATFLAEGFPLLTDDTLALHVQGDSAETIVHGQPGYPQMRMWPEQAEHFVEDYERLPKVLPAFSKRRVCIGEKGFGSFYPHSAPLAAIYLPERRAVEEHGEAIEILPVPVSEALFHLIRHSFGASSTNQLVDQQRRLKRLLPIVQTVPVYRLLYPSGFQYLPTVQQTVLSSVRRNSQAAQAGC